MLDQILTVAVGRNNDKGELSPHDWQRFQSTVTDLIRNNGGIIVFTGHGDGIRSDDPTQGVGEEHEDSRAWIIVANDANIEQIRQELARVLRHYEQSSACFSLDLAHEPTFATVDGYRTELTQVLA